jgi:hypothetical protein
VKAFEHTDVRGLPGNAARSPGRGVGSDAPSSHLAIWRESGARGLPVFMEKPFLLADELDQIDPAAPAGVT